MLRKLVELTTAQRAAFAASNSAEFMRLDKELENTMGTKERTIGAFKQHVYEHGCSA